VKVAAAVAGVVVVALVVATGGVAQATSGPAPDVSIHASGSVSRAGGLSVHSISAPVKGFNAARAQRAAAAGATVPLWSDKIVTGGKTYKYEMVGKNPFVKESTPSVTIGAPIVPVAFEFASGNNGGVFDPDLAECSESLSDINLVKGSPIFTKLTYTDGGTSLGSGEYVDIFQRANFWKYVGGSAKLNPNYGVNLAGTVEPTYTVTVGTNVGIVEGSGCNALGLVNFADWDSFLQKTVIPALAKELGPTKIPVFILRNIALYTNTTSNCCALGYHSGYTNTSGTPQFYTVTDIDDSGHFSGVQDVSDLAHEIGEWMDDPSGTNPTPPWGHVGQVPTSCQANLEVGDPLTGHNLAVTAANGITYHPQELTFFSWFYRQKPSIGVNGGYSLADTFTAPSAACT
jgi:hypothetical protein